MTEPGQAASSGEDKRAKAEEVIGEILRLMGVEARLEVKEQPAAQNGQNPGLSVAVFPEGEIPGVTPGKRSHVIDSLQFLSNKIVNRGGEKRWISIGVGGHPAPRQPQQPKEKPAPAPAQAPAAAAGKQPKQGKAEKKGKGKGEEKGKAPRAPQIDESKLEVADDPAISALGRELAQKSAGFGRFYAVTFASPEDRVRMARGAEGVEGSTFKMEGEGRNRRLVFVPANPKPMPKVSAMPDYDDEEEDAEE